MSGHSKWSTIKRSKGILDAKRGAVFTKHAKDIAVAARAGGDPMMNPSLRFAIDQAKADNMPKDNIERAIRKGTGEDKSAAQIEEVQYEAFGPEGIACLITALTDNRNRTAPDVRHIVADHDGKMGAPGSTAYLFDRMGYISLLEEAQTLPAEEIELLAIDLGAQDVQQSAGVIEIYPPANELARMRDALAEKGVVADRVKLVWKPKTVTRISDLAAAKKVLAFLEELEEHEDISSVATNLDLSEEVLQALAQGN